MEIVDAHSALLSNMEVLLLIKEQELKRAQANRTRKGQAAAAAALATTKPQNLLTIEFEVKKYLNKGSIKHLTPDTMHSLMQSLSKYPLTKAEKLQILNLRPTETIEFHVIIEELDERLTTMMIETLIADIETYWKLPKPVPKPAKDGSAATAAAGANDAGAAGADMPATMDDE